MSVCVYECMCMGVRVYGCTCVRVYVCTCVGVCIGVCVGVCVGVYVCVGVCMGEWPLTMILNGLELRSFIKRQNVTIIKTLPSSDSCMCVCVYVCMCVWSK